MKVVFENNGSDRTFYRRLTLETVNGNLRILSEDGYLKGHSMEGVENHSIYTMNPKQLRDYIGALLHIQSKLVKKGGNHNG